MAEYGGLLLAGSAALVLPVLDLRAWQEHVVCAATALFGLGETAIIELQAWRGVPSHYNFTTPMDAALMRGGAAGTAAVFLVAVVVLLAVAARTAGPTRRSGSGCWRAARCSWSAVWSGW